MKQLEDTKLISEQLQFYRASNMPPQQVSILLGTHSSGKVTSPEAAVCRQRNRVPELIKLMKCCKLAASSSRNKLPQCSSMNYHGHDHEDKRNQQQPVVTAPQDFGYLFQMQTKDDEGRCRL